MSPVSPNWTALTSTLCSDNSHETTTCSCCSPWHRFTPLFSQEDIPKVQNLELERGRGGVMGSKSQRVPSLPGHKPCTSLLPSLLPTPRFSRSTNKACPTRNGAACSDLPQKGRFSEKCHRQSSKDVESVLVVWDVSGPSWMCKQGAGGGCAGLLRNFPWLPAPGTVQCRKSTALLQPQQN